MSKILVIDDESQVRRAICLMLSRAGFVAIEAADGAEGLRLAQSENPDAVITDILMPNKEGIETVRDLRRAKPGLPILVISGHAGSALYMEMARLLGAHAALAKPFRAADLLAAVRRLLPPAAPA